MRLTDTILTQINSTYDGDAWHGTPLRKILDGIDDAKAHARPIADAHTIAELAAHIAADIEIVERRARLEHIDITPEMDFPNVDGVAFSEIVARIERAHAKLVETVAKIPDEQFEQIVPGKKYTYEFMLFGVVNHNAYHSAQIALLKKAI